METFTAHNVAVDAVALKQGRFKVRFFDKWGLQYRRAFFTFAGTKVRSKRVSVMVCSAAGGVVEVAVSCGGLFSETFGRAQKPQVETFFQNHAFLLQRMPQTVRRGLMDTIDWSYRLIGVRGPRGVGKTSFLIQYAKEHYDPLRRQCLYINANNFYFQGRGIVDFADEFIRFGGIVLLIDQAFKLPSWQTQLVDCYHKYPRLRIVYTTTTVQAEDANSEFATLTREYVLHGFSLRNFINEQTGLDLPACPLEEILANHEHLTRAILQKLSPGQYFTSYLHHGYYPFYLENRNFTEALLKAMNMMIEVDILFTKQVDLNYLSRIKKLLYLLALGAGKAPNVSRLAKEIGTSRATVMNYLSYLEEARLLNLVYEPGESFPKKPATLMLHDTNLMYAVYGPKASEQTFMETFLVACLWRHHRVNKGQRDGMYRVDDTTDFIVCEKYRRVKVPKDCVVVKYNVERDPNGHIPIWLFGFLH